MRIAGSLAWFPIRERRSIRRAVALAFGTALLLFHITQEPAQGRSGAGQEAASEKNIALGLNHFMAHCATCHGEMGKAETEKGKRLGAADLTSRDVQSRSDEELFEIISKGVPRTAMPAFGKSHTASEIRQTILFLRRLPALTVEEKKRLEAAVPDEARHQHGADHKTEEGTTPHTGHAAEGQHQHQTEGGRQPEKATGAPSVTPAAEHQHSQQSDKSAGDHAGHDMSGHDMNAMMRTITGGPFRSVRSIGSGTSLLPASSPGYMWHWLKDDWFIMMHGDLKVGFNHQGGPRGVNKAESQNWLMFMAEHSTPLSGKLMFRGMFSAEPGTAPRRGFPELFQTGESWKGQPIIDAQHPHDLFMELAASFTLPLSESVSVNLYGGPVAEPALGPTAFMHRLSASENPAAPLGHHWQDSTHIAHGVVTAGLTAWKFKIEGSIFRGAEPDEHRTDIELGKLDSWSTRVWFTPTPNWALQISHGHLKDPEALQPGNTDRTTASIAYNRQWSDGNWATTLIWGRNSETHGDSNAYLLESTANFLDKNYLFTRLELADKIGLLQQNIFGRSGLIGDPHSEDQWFRIGAFTFGGVRDLVASPRLRLGVGADATFYRVPDGLTSIYGSSPTSFHVFLRLRPGKMSQ